MNTYFTRGKDQNKSRLLSVVLIIALLFCCTGLSGCGKKSGKALSEYWAADSEAAESLRQYVSKVTNKKDCENFIVRFKGYKQKGL